MELEKQNEQSAESRAKDIETRWDGEVDSPPEAENDKNIIDPPPEFCQYRDEGCELAESCLNCPFPKCIYDQPGGKRRWLKKRRDREIVRVHTNEGKNVKELVEMFGVTERTVQRTLKAARNAKDKVH